MRSPFRNKYETEPAYKNAKLIHLRTLTDGFKRTLVHDGPFEGERNWQLATPKNGTDNLLRQIKKRIPDPLGGPEDTIPVYVWDDVTAPPPRIWDRKVNDFVTPAVMTPHYRACMERLVEQRNGVAIQAAKALEAKQAAQDAAATEGMTKMFAAFAANAERVKPAKERKNAQAD